MPGKSRLGRLLIAFGPEVGDSNVLNQHVGRFRTEPHQVTLRMERFYWRIPDPNPNPFHSWAFGHAVEGLLRGDIVIVMDERFDDQRQRGKVEKAYKRIFPTLLVDHVQVGGGAEIASAREQIVVDSDVYDEGIDSTNESISVDSDADQTVLQQALRNATTRMMRVGDDGREYPDLPLFYQNGGMVTRKGSLEDVYTPNFVSDVTEDEQGRPGFYIDCKGAIEPPMAAKFRQILVEEFRKLGITSAHVRVRV